MQPAHREPIPMAMQQHGGRTKVLAPLQEPAAYSAPVSLRSNESVPEDEWNRELPCSFQPG
jgi:hypothetical protein